MSSLRLNRISLAKALGVDEGYSECSLRKALLVTPPTLRHCMFSPAKGAYMLAALGLEISSAAAISCKAAVSASLTLSPPIPKNPPSRAALALF